MIYSGWAFKPNEDELNKEILDRYNQIKFLKKKAKFIKKGSAASFTFVVTSEDPNFNKLSDEDILILADDGNLCFGGKCEKINPKTWEGLVYTD